MPLTRAEHLIDLLLARQQPRSVLEKTTRLPYGWALWLRSLGPLPPSLHAREVIAVLLPRPLPGPPGRSPQLPAWQALRRLFWQDWDAAPRDQRWMRWTSALVSALLHLLFFVLLLWVAVIRTTAPEEEGAEGERVQVEFVGRATQEGGGDQPGADAAAAAAAAGQVAAGRAAGAASAPEPRPAAASAPAAAPVPVPTASVPAPRSETEPAPVAAPPPSPVQATEVAEASTDFVVPPVSVPRTEVSIVPRDTALAVRERSVQPVQTPPAPVAVHAPSVAVRTPQVRDIQVQEREVSTVDAPVVPQPLRTADVPVRVAQRDVQVREREVQAVVDPQVRMASVAGREPTVHAPAGRDVQVREREVASAPAAAASTSSGSAPAATPTPAASGSAAQASSAHASAPATTPAQAGARPAPDPGNWATPAKGDDWGASSRNRDGASSGARQASTSGKGDGLFNADGSVRVPGQEGSGHAERGAPGGANDGWSKERIAQSGTWLKRPPYDYTPTSFDKYWVPQESLLAEWVRKGIKSMEIPLPGTRSKISCVISILQAGGGCGLTNPNMQDQPAVARPPPDIPFKKALQEDNGSR